MPEPAPGVPGVPPEARTAFYAAFNKTTSAKAGIDAGLAAAAPVIAAAERQRIAAEIEQEVCAPGTQCRDRFCPDCVRYRQALADAKIARREAPGGQ